MKNILFPTELSSHAVGVFEFALLLAQKTGATVRMFSAYGKPDSRFDYKDKLEERSQTLISNMQAFVAKHTPPSFAHIKFEYETAIDFPAAAILRNANERPTDLIIMGMRDDDEEDSLVMDKVAAEVIRETDCPVLAVPQQVDFEKFKSFVMTTDFAFNDLLVMNQLRKWASWFDADIHCLHVFEEDERAEVINAKMQVLINTYKDGIPPVDFDVRRGELRTDLKDYLKEVDADLLVMLSSKRNLITQLFNPSKTLKIAAVSDVPLLVYKGV